MRRSSERWGEKVCETALQEQEKAVGVLGIWVYGVVCALMFYFLMWI